MVSANKPLPVAKGWDNVGVVVDKSDPVKVGTTVHIRANVVGNESDLLYKVVVMQKGWEEWEPIQEYSRNKVVAWTPKKPGRYSIYVDVKDKSGKEVTKYLEEYFVLSGGSPMKEITLSASKASVSAGKTYYLKASTNSSGKPIYFSTNNSNVATVSNGLVYAVAPGTARITAYDENGSVLRSFTINVLPFEPIRFAYTSPNNASLNSKVNLIAITDKSRDAVKFVVAGKEIMATSKESYGNTYVWTASTIANKAGEFGVKAYSRKSGSWSTCSDADTSMFVNTSSATTSKVENRRVSDKGINFIAQCEGYVGHVYEDQLAGGILTLGYGKTIAPGETFYNNITQKEAYAMLLRSVNAGSYASSVNKFLCGKGVKYNQRHFDSLVSFTYNLGSRWMSKDKELNDYISKAKGRDLSNVDRDGFSYEILRYHHSGGNHILGLLFRRMDEMRIFFNGNYERHTWRYNPDNFRIPSCIANQW